MVRFVTQNQLKYRRVVKEQFLDFYDNNGDLNQENFDDCAEQLFRLMKFKGVSRKVFIERYIKNNNCRKMIAVLKKKSLVGRLTSSSNSTVEKEKEEVPLDKNGYNSDVTGEHQSKKSIKKSDENVPETISEMDDIPMTGEDREQSEQIIFSSRLESSLDTSSSLEHVSIAETISDGEDLEMFIDKSICSARLDSFGINEELFSDDSMNCGFCDVSIKSGDSD